MNHSWYSLVMNNEFAGEDDFKLEGAAFIDMRLLDQLSDIRDLCAAFAENPIEKNSKPLSEAATNHLKAMHIALEQIDDKSGSEENINEMVEYAVGLEKQRVAFLNEIDDKEYESYTVAIDDYEVVRDHLLQEECDDDESIAGHIYNLYQTSFQIDINQLSAISTSNYEEKPSVKRKAMLKKIGLQALDVAKVSLGVYIGIAAAKKSKLL